MRFAIVGVSVRLPGADGVAPFWRQLLGAAPAYRAVDADEAVAEGIPPATFEHPRHVAVASPLSDLERFPARHFGIVSGEAELIDPQQRMLLVLAAEALETVGGPGDSARTGVITSVSASTYAETRVRAHRPWNVVDPDYPAMLGNEKDFAATRIAHRLDLRGPAMSVQTACSSSLVAVHQAAMHLAIGDADRMVVAAASAVVPQFGGYRYQEGGVLSPTGTCRPFGNGSDGTVKGNGGAAVVLRRYDDAVADGDDVLAILEATAVNNDGAGKVGFTAPSPAGQRAVIEAALRASGLSPAAIGFVECHGTATRLGDPIEIRALSRAHGAADGVRCAVGSLKAVYGHLDAAAGLVALVKAVMTVRTRSIAPQPRLDAGLNPELGLERTRFDVPFEPERLPAGAAVAVSSFGMGGTNAHAIVSGPTAAGEAGLPAAQRTDSPAAQRIDVTADDHESLRTTLTRLADHFDLLPDLPLADVAATLAARRRGRLMWSAEVSTIAELRDATRAAAAADTAGSPTTSEDPVDVPHRRVYLPATALPLESVDLPPLTAPDVAATEAGSPDVVSPDFVRRRLAHVLGRETLGADSDFFALGGESIHLVDVVAAVEQRHGCTVDFATLDGVSRVGTIIDRIVQSSAPAGPTAPPAGPFVEIGTGNDPLYLYPPAGGTNFCYTDLHRCEPHLRISAFRPVDTAAAPTIEEVAARCVAALPPVPGLRIGGYSYGGNVAVEMALQMEAAGRPPAEVVLFDSHPPSSYHGDGLSPEEYDRAIAAIIENAGLEEDSPLHRVGTTDRTSGVFAAFHRTWQANHRALARHRPVGRTSARITVFSALDVHPQAELDLLRIEPAGALGWQEFATAPITVIPVPGNHYTMFTSSANRPVLARALADHVTAANDLPTDATELLSAPLFS